MKTTQTNEKKEELRPKIKATSVAHMVWIRKVWHGAVNCTSEIMPNYASLKYATSCQTIRTVCG